MENVKVQFYMDDFGVFAAFPDFEEKPENITIYAHIGQHYTATKEYLNCCKKPKKAEYLPLLKELESIYNDCKLTIKK